jgi:hypothetical protein
MGKRARIPFKDINGRSVNVKTEFLINPWDLEDE